MNTPTIASCGCIDLRPWLGDRDRIGWDPADASGHRDPWLMTVPCRFGTVYPHGGDRLAVEGDGHKNVVARLRRLAGVRLHQGGDREFTFVFHGSLFLAVAALVRPRKRRRMTEEQRLRAAERLGPWRFQRSPGEPGHRGAQEPQAEAPERGSTHPEVGGGPGPSTVA